MKANFPEDDNVRLRRISFEIWSSLITEFDDECNWLLISFIVKFSINKFSHLFANQVTSLFRLRKFDASMFKPCHIHLRLWKPRLAWHDNVLCSLKRFFSMAIQGFYMFEFGHTVKFSGPNFNNYDNVTVDCLSCLG